MRHFAWVLSLLLLLFATQPAQADQRQDWILAAGNDGSYVTLDFIFGAVQAAVEHRMKVYGGSNLLTVRAAGLGALPFGSSQADVELRLLNLTLGVSGGYQSVWRNQSFAAGARLDRKERRQRDAAGEFNTDSFPFWEGRAGLAFPINDYVVLNHVTAYRISDAADRSFNNLTNVIDDGESVRTDFQLFFKHEDFGGLAPVFQILNFPLSGEWHTQYNYGFMLVTRAGLVQRDDLLIWQMLFHTGPVFGGGYDNRDNYGSAMWRGPFTFLLAYRSVIGL